MQENSKYVPTHAKSKRLINCEKHLIRGQKYKLMEADSMAKVTMEDFTPVFTKRKDAAGVSARKMLLK